MDCDAGFWIAEVLPAFRPGNSKDTHVLVTHLWQLQIWMRYSIALKMHTLARTTPFIHSPELSYVFPHRALNLHQQDQ